MQAPPDGEKPQMGENGMEPPKDGERPERLVLQIRRSFFVHNHKKEFRILTLK